MVARTQDGRYEARCLEMEEAVKRGKTMEEALVRISEIIAMMLEERTEAAKRAGKTLVEMEVEISPW